MQRGQVGSWAVTYRFYGRSPWKRWVVHITRQSLEVELDRALAMICICDRDDHPAVMDHLIMSASSETIEQWNIRMTP